jgi:tetratricopeptide (TPR) repeat protein
MAVEVPRRSRTDSAITADADSGVRVAQKALFYREGAYWTVGFGARAVRLKDTKGLGYIAHLLRHPKTEFHVLDLYGGVASQRTDDWTGQPVSGSSRAADDLEKARIHITGPGDAGKILDAQAKSNYRRRLSELREELEEAKKLGDLRRAEQAEREIDALTSELSRAVRLGGRNRRAASASERSRQSITKSIKSTLDTIGRAEVTLAELLSRCIKTGTFCVYRPDPNFPIAWQFAAAVTDPPEQSSPADIAGAIDDRAQSTPVLLGVAPLSLAERTVFVGRETEQAAIRAFIDRALSGNGSLVMLGGGPGVGKSRLAMEMAQHAARAGLACFVGRCYERDEPFPYLPFVEIIESSLAQMESPADFRQLLGNNAAELAQLAPALRRVFPDIPPPPEIPPAQKRYFFFQSLSEVLARVARTRPLFIVLDDLHWADEATLALLTYLANRIPPPPVVIVGTYRDEYPEHNPALVRTLEELIRLGIRPMKLAGLSKNAVAQMLDGMCRRQVPERLVAAIFEESQGNPFFVEELYRHLIEDGKVYDTAGEFLPDFNFEEDEVPETVRLVLGRRLQRLSDESRQILTSAAVIGRNFRFELLQATLHSFEIAQLLSALEEAQHMGLLLETSGTESELNFAHELVRQALLTGISKPKKQRLHLDVAEAIELVDAARLNEQAAVLADHLRKAGPFADAAKTSNYFALAGKNSLDVAAYEEALRSFEAAVSYRPDDARCRAECLKGMVRAYRGLGQWEQALDRCREAVEIYRELGDTEMIANGLYEAVDALLLMGQYQAAVEMGQRGLAELQDQLKATRADILAALGLTYGVIGDYVRARSTLDEAMSLANRLSNPRILAGVHSNLSVLNGVYLEVAEDLSNSKKVLEWDQSHGYPSLRAIALNEQMMAWHRIGRVEEATRVSQELEELARRIGHIVFLATCIWTKAWAEFGKAPNLNRLEELLSQSVELSRARVPMITAQSLGQLSLAKFFRGDVSSAINCALEANQLAVPGYVEGFLAGIIFRERAYAGEHAAAIALLEDTSVRLPQKNQPNSLGCWAFLVSVVEGLAILEEHERAAELYPLACGLLDTGMITFPMVARYPQTIAGVAATSAREWQKAEGHFRVALAQAEKTPDQLESADVRRFYGAMLLERNSPKDADRARSLLTAALEGYSRIGMPIHIEVTKALLALT